MVLVMYYPSVTGPGICTYEPANPELLGRLSIDYELIEGELSVNKAVQAATQLAYDATQYLNIPTEVGSPFSYLPNPKPAEE